jgi:hypothetical protein
VICASSFVGTCTTDTAPKRAFGRIVIIETGAEHAVGAQKQIEIADDGGVGALRRRHLGQGADDDFRANP